jgi:chemotaxis methyl-accepting protein methylase
VLCRNVLIYLGREAQCHAFETLLASLANGGFICLGEAEWPPSSFAYLLEPIDKRCRVFRAAKTAGAR